MLSPGPINQTPKGDAALPRMPQLDALRGLAVLCVMYQHFAPDQRWLSYVPLARLGVQLFFVLSGFLITSILLVARERIDCGESRLFEVRQFYARRFLRIFPLYYLVVLGAALAGISGFRQPLLWHLAYMTNVYNAMTGRWAGASAHLWTLSVEEQFYFFWPWLILLMPKRWLLPALFGFVATGPLFRAIFEIFGWSRMALYTLTPASFDAFGCGALLALARRWKESTGNQVLQRRLTRIGLFAGIPAVLITFSSLAWGGNYPWIFTIGANLALSFLFTWLITQAADGWKGTVGHLLTWPPLLYIGKISYGLYIFHFIFAFSVFKPALTLPVLRILKPAMRWDAASILTLSLMTFTAATLSWFLYERPVLRLKRLFPYIRPLKDMLPESL